MNECKMNVITVLVLYLVFYYKIITNCIVLMNKKLRFFAYFWSYPNPILVSLKSFTLNNLKKNFQAIYFLRKCSGKLEKQSSSKTAGDIKLDLF